MDDELVSVTTALDFVPNVKRINRSGRNWPVLSISGKDTYEYATLIDQAHQAGLMSVITEIVNLDLEKEVCVVLATASFSDGSVFTGIGDADKFNTGKHIAAHYIRMAETRAVSRALTKGLNAETVAAEEMGEDGEPVARPRVASSQQAAAPRQAPQQQQQQRTGNTGSFDLPIPEPNNGSNGWVCVDCGTGIRDSKNYSAGQLAAISVKKSGAVFCYNCREAQAGAQA